MPADIRQQKNIDDYKPKHFPQFKSDADILISLLQDMNIRHASTLEKFGASSQLAMSTDHAYLADEKIRLSAFRFLNTIQSNSQNDFTLTPSNCPDLLTGN